MARIGKQEHPVSCKWSTPSIARWPRSPPSTAALRPISTPFWASCGGKCLVAWTRPAPSRTQWRKRARSTGKNSFYRLGGTPSNRSCSGPLAGGSGSGESPALEPKGSRLRTPSTADAASSKDVGVSRKRPTPSMAAVPRQELPAGAASTPRAVVERLPAPGAIRKAAGVGASLSKPGMALVMRTAEGEENMTPFRSIDDLLSAVKPILRAAARSPDMVWFSIHRRSGLVGQRRGLTERCSQWMGGIIDCSVTGNAGLFDRSVWRVIHIEIGRVLRLRRATG